MGFWVFFGKNEKHLKNRGKWRDFEGVTGGELV
jgi:hypothetical protein